MATWLTSWLASQSVRASKPAVVVAKVRTSRLSVPVAEVRIRLATTVSLCTSSPAQRSYKTRIPIAELLSFLLY